MWLISVGRRLNCKCVEHRRRSEERCNYINPAVCARCRLITANSPFAAPAAPDVAACQLFSSSPPPDFLGKHTHWSHFCCQLACLAIMRPLTNRLATSSSSQIFRDSIEKFPRNRRHSGLQVMPMRFMRYLHIFILRVSFSTHIKDIWFLSHLLRSRLVPRPSFQLEHFLRDACVCVCVSFLLLHNGRLLMSTLAMGVWCAPFFAARYSYALLIWI